MQRAPNNCAAFIGHLRRLITDDGSTAGIFAAVAAASILAFGFGATADIVGTMLVVGVVSALAETRLRDGKKS
ncbi:MAG: hypothetical protein ABJA75_06460 [Bradyrhizobium sp.]